MAYTKMQISNLVKAIQSKVESATGIRCYHSIEENTPRPLYFVEVVKTMPANTKTMFRDNMTVYIHCITKAQDSSDELYSLIRKLQEALTEDVALQEPFELIIQADKGVQKIETDKTNERHAVVQYDFAVCYKFQCK